MDCWTEGVLTFKANTFREHPFKTQQCYFCFQICVGVVLTVKYISFLFTVHSLSDSKYIYIRNIYIITEDTAEDDGQSHTSLTSLLLVTNRSCGQPHLQSMALTY